ncbi:hypothetical protein [Verrucomicrobium sp. 3C]|uniref:hypothetical protein n=1 Tax=Verrucomicrobium sp. 3C TaxID=1134055 RepID=UPI00037DEB0A|nr:hypothetical protein [Verrucomicrobium sp. 3C]
MDGGEIPLPRSGISYHGLRSSTPPKSDPPRQTARHGVEASVLATQSRIAKRDALTDSCGMEANDLSPDVAADPKLTQIAEANRTHLGEIGGRSPLENPLGNRDAAEKDGPMPGPSSARTLA